MEKNLIKELSDMLDDKLDTRFAVMEAKFDEKLGTMEAKFDEKLGTMEAKFDKQISELKTICLRSDKEIAQMRRDIRSMNEVVYAMGHKVENLQSTVNLLNEEFVFVKEFIPEISKRVRKLEQAI